MSVHVFYSKNNGPSWISASLLCLVSRSFLSELLILIIFLHTLSKNHKGIQRTKKNHYREEEKPHCKWNATKGNTALRLFSPNYAGQLIPSKEHSISCSEIKEIGVQWQIGQFNLQVSLSPEDCSQSLGPPDSSWTCAEEALPLSPSIYERQPRLKGIVYYVL